MLKELLNNFETNRDKIETWLESKRKHFSPIVYASCDIRNSGYKVTTVDTNIFPAGWNNLCPSYQKKASAIFKEYFEENHAKCVLVVIEEHTRNLFYFSNVWNLQKILQDAGLTVYIGTPNPEVTEKTTFKTADNEDLEVYPIKRQGDEIYIEDHKVCSILFNNDFSDGIPSILDGITQRVMPNPELGWFKRRKSEHFRVYNNLVDEFAEIVGFDSWHLKTEFAVVENVDINNDDDRDRLALETEKILTKIAAEYTARSIDRKPVVFIKNDAGTYGMGVISVESADEIRNLNRKNRNKLAVGKENVPITNFIIQEGVPTTDKVKGFTAEPVMYLVGAKPVGGFFRVNEEKGDDENLNSTGMKFVKLCFEEVLGYENTAMECDCNKECLDKLYRLIATLAALAASEEQFNLE
jgi:glutamate--cysteine ligase